MEKVKLLLRLLAALTLVGLSSSKSVPWDKPSNKTNGVWLPSQTFGPRSHEGVWSSWGAWSPCSRTCGGGVAVQSRQCLPSPSADNKTRSGRRRRKLSLVNDVMDSNHQDLEHRKEGYRSHTLSSKGGSKWRCAGLDKRYHECNTLTCPGAQKDFRSEQCSSYNKRPFRGRYFVWLPYVDEKNPCTLNCRPAGHAFYSSLARAIDGTVCDKPGFRAICVQGQCKAVGLDGVVSQWGPTGGGSGQASCGSRLVSGLFTRPQMPLGYTLLTTIPQGACRINVTEMQHSNNFLAMKITNGSFVINGNFAISWSGEYEAAGTKFFYRRQSGNMVEAISAPGPLTQAIDVMILYQHPNPGIKYEYTIQIPPDEENPPPKPSAIAPTLLHGFSNSSSSRHYSLPSVRNQYKPIVEQDKNAISSSNNQDQFTAKEVPEVDDNAIDQKKSDPDKYPYGQGVLATESERPHPHQGNSRHRKRKFVWQILRYTQCSKPCAGVQTPIYSCVRESTQTPVPDRRCGPKPSSNPGRACGGPCAPRWAPAPWGPCSATCGIASQARQLHCRQDQAHDALNVKVSDLLCLDKPLSSIQKCQLIDCPNMDSEIQLKSNEVNPANLQPNHVRGETIPRVVHHPRSFRDRDEVDRFTDSESSIVTRYINETRTKPNNGNDELSNEVSGGNGYRNGGHWKASNAWIYSEWTQECSEECGKGVQTRMVRCADPSGCDDRRKPAETRACSSDRKCSVQSYKWFTGPWSPCSDPCAINGKMSREVVCLAYFRGQHRISSGCPTQKRPDSERACPPSMLRADCQPEWFTSDWSQCVGSCGNTQQSRLVTCQGTPSSCTQPQPPTHRDCVPSQCHIGGFTPAPKTERDRQDENSLDDPQQTEECIDKISTCLLAVQARLCPYKYYASSCCAACRRASSLS